MKKLYLILIVMFLMMMVACSNNADIDSYVINNDSTTTEKIESSDNENNKKTNSDVNGEILYSINEKIFDADGYEIYLDNISLEQYHGNTLWFNFSCNKNDSGKIIYIYTSEIVINGNDLGDKITYPVYEDCEVSKVGAGIDNIFNGSVSSISFNVYYSYTNYDTRRGLPDDAVLLKSYSF